MPGSASSRPPGGGCQAPSLSPSTGTRSPGAADLSSRDFSVLDTDSQAGDDGDAFDFFQQQDRVEGEGLPTLDQKGQDAGKSSEEEEEEEEEALDPLGIMRYVSPSGWGPRLAFFRFLSPSWESEKTGIPGLLPLGAWYSGNWLSARPNITWVFGAQPRYLLPLPAHRVAPRPPVLH